MALLQSNIEISQLRPTQMAVGMLQVKHKRLRLRSLEKRPAELVEFILLHPIRVVLGPKQKAYVIDHHHLALALMKEKFETAPMLIEQDYSSFDMPAFWKKMIATKCVYLFDDEGQKAELTNIPKSLTQLTDDPYRSLAGFVREAGGFVKVQIPFAEFRWAQYYRGLISIKLIKNHFDKALAQALALAHVKEANHLPGFVKSPVK